MKTRHKEACPLISVSHATAHWTHAVTDNNKLAAAMLFWDLQRIDLQTPKFLIKDF
jgi:hypothetical protein